MPQQCPWNCTSQTQCHMNQPQSQTTGSASLPSTAAPGGSYSLCSACSGTHVGSHLPQHEQHADLLLNVHLLRALPGRPLAVHPLASSGDCCGVRSMGVSGRDCPGDRELRGSVRPPTLLQGLVFESPEQVASCLFPQDPTSPCVHRAQARETEVIQTPGRLCLPPREMGCSPHGVPGFQSQHLHQEQEGHNQRQLALPPLEELWDQHPAPSPKAALSGKAPGETKRPAPGLGSKESLNGDRWAGALGHWTQAHCHHPHRPTPPVPGSSCRQQLCPGARGTRPAEGPRREVPGFPLRESQWRGSQAGGVGLQICNSWTSQK